MSTTSSEVATLGGGCFWCLEAVFRELHGVQKVVSGYAGGTLDNPTYRQVCTGSTGHAEVVQIEFDPTVISYRDLLEVFFATHDPTTLNRQGVDEGTQYRSVIFFHDARQEETARQLLAELRAEEAFPGPIVTEVVPLTNFYPAEDYHQDYYTNNTEEGYCRVVIAPKLAKFRDKFMHLRVG
jgi:peptide-methionine (S)-S-oxide reductase